MRKISLRPLKELFEEANKTKLLRHFVKVKYKESILCNVINHGKWPHILADE